MTQHCEQCGGPLVFLGALGELAHFRCRDCGVDCSAWNLEPCDEPDLVDAVECPHCGEITLPAGGGECVDCHFPTYF